MNDIGPPPKKKVHLQAPPFAADTKVVNNMSTADTKDRTVDLNFKVPLGFRRDFKTMSSELDMPMVRLLQIMQDEYIERHGDELQHVSHIIKKLHQERLAKKR